MKYATIASEEKAAGRTGMGAVMGSKKLKAISVRGKKKSFEAADPEGFKNILSNVQGAVMASFASQMLASLGTSGGLDMYNMQGEFPTHTFISVAIEAFHPSGLQVLRAVRMAV